MEKTIHEVFREVEIMFESARKDMTKNLDNVNMLAGKRGRRTLRELKKHLTLLVRMSIEHDKVALTNRTKEKKSSTVPTEESQ